MTKWYASQVHMNGSTYKLQCNIPHQQKKEENKKHMIISIGKKN